MDNTTGRLLEINPSTTEGSNPIHYRRLTQFKTLQSKVINLPPDLSACYSFQGAPDVTVHSCAISNKLGGRRDSAQSDESSDHELIENSLVKPEEAEVGTKLAMHMILVRKLLKKFLSQKASVP